HLCIGPDRNRLSGYRIAAGAAARRRRALAEAGILRGQFHSGRHLQLWPSDRDVVAAEHGLSAGEPRQPGHRPCQGGDAQSAGAAEAALPGLRFPQGRPHAQGRSAGHVPAGKRGAGAGRTVVVQCLGGRRENRCGRAGRPSAARSRIAGGAERDAFSVQTASLYFGTASLGAAAESMERWQPGEEPIIVTPDAVDPDMKKTASLPVRSDPVSRADENGESIAAKGEVNTDNQHTMTPAERLGLFDAKVRAKSEKCLAEAVYFEARGEAVRGQIAVAQVVMNRAFSGFYPTTVCGVVYQNKHHHMACQFTFACDNVPDVVREPDMWDRARKIAKAMLDGQLWLPEVGKSTHYHAYWVHPSWV